MLFNKDELKKSLTIDQIEELITNLGGAPRRQGSILVCKTICHQGNSSKLYYYPNSCLFHCYTNCGSFDIFDLIIKIKKCEGQEYSLTEAMLYIANYFSINFEEDFSDKRDLLQDWEIFNKYEKITNDLLNKKDISLKKYDDKILNNLPQPHIIPWEEEGITHNICLSRQIRYNPISHGIVIPHYDIDNNLVGIRERTLIKENEIYGKYRPAYINNKLYNHPLGYNLYNLNYSKNNIAATHTAILFESEKSCLKYASIFGKDVDITAAVCGSNITNYQIDLLKNLKVQEIIIAFDREGQEDNKEKYVKKFYNFYHKFGHDILISFMYDKDGDTLDYKSSPIDEGKDKFLYLYKNRITLT